MIPASYLFKDIYHQHWEEAPEASAHIEKNPRFIDGLMTPIASAIAAVLARRGNHGTVPHRHVYE
jgi:hypothetical protein